MKLTKQQVIDTFRFEILPIIKERYERDGVIDRPARSEAWNDYTDSLCKDGQITLKQYETWVNPF